MSRTRLLTCLALAISLVIPAMVMAQSAGTIYGRILDSSTGEALPGAVVLLKGTSLGASTTLNGRYSISSIPPGKYKLRVSYIGYLNRDITINVTAGSRIREDVRLKAVGVKGKGVVVTAQASGQNAAINRQLTSHNIVDVVSAARIQALPDANAAESVGRLPGVYLLRSGGEGYEVAIRGLQPKYNEVLIDGVEMPATSSDGRSTNLSMISSDILNSIEVYKTVTPDMDAAVLGGVVNFGIREAQRTSNGAPEIELETQGGYDNLQSRLNDYKFSGTIGDRFLDNKFGILVQGSMENVNLTSDVLGANYYLPDNSHPKVTALSNLNLTYSPSTRKRYGGTLVMDYRLPQGKIDLMNFFSQSNTITEKRNQEYSLLNNEIVYNEGYTPNTLNIVTNLLAYQQKVLSFNVDARLSNSYTENITRGNWTMDFVQEAAGVSSIPYTESPVQIAQAAAAMTHYSQMNWGGYTVGEVNLTPSYLKRRDITGSVDIERNFNLSDAIAGDLKFGGSYKWTNSYYNFDEIGGGFGNVQRAMLLQSFPWMTKYPYNLNPDGNQAWPIAIFADPGYNYGNFLGGSYSMGLGTNLQLIGQVLNTAAQKFAGQSSTFEPRLYSSGASDYHGNEYESAAYIMATLNIGPQLTVIPGVRYQGLKTSYWAPTYFDQSAPDPYPDPLPHTDTTMNEYHGYWLPDVSVNYKPFLWLNIRGAYTNTLAYPDINQITPRLDVNDQSTSVTWNNYALKPARSQNYDLALSVYNNSIGLFAVDGFLKQIDNLIFATGTRYITNAAEYPGVPVYTKGYSISTAINDPYRVNLWGTELEWETHFWYLPGVLSGLVFDINYTHIFSSAKYPETITHIGGYPSYLVTHVDTFYTDRLIDQPNNIVNLSVGYDYQGFSVVASMIYQANVFYGTAFYSSLRSDKAQYYRWDLAVKQNLPWHGLQLYANLNDLNNESDIYVIRGSGFPTSEQDYGMSASLGLRWSMN